MKKIELLAPAGDLPRLKTAIRFGADAVYAGLPDFSLRNPREITFTKKTLKEGIDFVHSHGKKIYLTFNIFPHEKDLSRLEKKILNIKDLILSVDGIIVSDLGMFSIIKKNFPEIPIHISTQANTLNSEAIKMWKKLGASRIVLARELTLKEIKEIKKKMKSPFFAKASKGDFDKVKIEVFGHGAMCIAYSGRCLLSKYYTDREANLGDCSQSCRWRYRLKTQKHYMEEELRLNDLVEVQEDSRGTYFLNSKEICTIDILGKFIKSGIDALKIEGRAKSVYYVAMVTRIYRKAIDAYYNENYNKKLVKELQKELDLVSNRGYSHGFLLGENEYEQNYETTAIKPPIIFVGLVLGTKNDLIQVEVKNKFKVGENIEIITPPSTTLGTSDEIHKTKIIKIFDKNMNEIKEALNPQDKVWLQIDNRLKIPRESIIRKIKKRSD